MCTERFSNISSISRNGAKILGMKTARRATSAPKALPWQALTVTIAIDPLVDVVRRHVELSPELSRLIKLDLERLLHQQHVATKPANRRRQVGGDFEQVLSTQEAADLVGVSRPFIVARIDAGDIPLYQQVGNQRRVLKSAVEAWHRRDQVRRHRALGQLGRELDSEIFSR